MKILITIAYDGTNYCGWQRQNNQVTVQEEVEKGIKKLFGRAIEVIGASRTDSKVHALGQRATFNVSTTIPLSNIPLALNNNLPNDIRITKAEEVKDTFHPQYNAINKTYSYKIYNSNIINPMYNNYAWLVKQKLNTSNMQKAAHFLLGKHNFLSFCATGSSAKTFEREIYDITINNREVTQNKFSQCNNMPIIEIFVTGNGFLYNMVRIIVGTLVYVGCGKLSVDDIKSILLSQDRTKAGITAPAMGLVLCNINYDFTTTTA